MTKYYPVLDVVTSGIFQFVPASPATIFDKIDDVSPDDETTKVILDDVFPSAMQVQFEPIPVPAVDDTVSFTIRYKIPVDFVGPTGLFVPPSLVINKALTASADWTTIKFVLTPAEVASITNWSSLIWAASALGGDKLHVTQLFVEVEPPFVAPVRPAVDVVIPTRGQDTAIPKRGQDVVIPDLTQS